MPRYRLSHPPAPVTPPRKELEDEGAVDVSFGYPDIVICHGSLRFLRTLTQLVCGLVRKAGSCSS